MFRKFRQRWSRKGGGRRLAEMVTMAVVAAAVKAVCDWLEVDSQTAELVLAVIVAYVGKLLLPAEK